MGDFVVFFYFFCRGSSVYYILEWFVVSGVFILFFLFDFKFLFGFYENFVLSYRLLKLNGFYKFLGGVFLFLEEEIEVLR